MHVDIREVGPRDGFQNEPEIVPTDTKVRLIELLAAAGLKRIATEDLVSVLHEMGLEAGVALDVLVDAARAAQDVLGRPLSSHVLTAGPVVWNDRG